ncbi:MAG: CPBP family glutamic-type intramembrane protease [Bacteroidota bacterium]
MPLLTLEKPKVFRDVKEAPMLLLLLVLLSDITFNWLYINFFRDAFAIPEVYTSGVVDSLFVLSIIKIAFVVLGVVFWIGRFRGRHLGLGWSKLKEGLIATFFIWAILQAVQVAYGMVVSTEVGYHIDWQQEGALKIIGAFILYAIGKAFFDELTYRGLLLPQLHLKCQRYLNLDARIILGLAVVISQTIYLIIQLPLISLFISTGFSSVMTLTSLFFLSILNALIYLRTKNLYITIGMHAIWFQPIFVASPAVPHTFILVLLAIGFILVWPMLPNAASMQSTWPLEERRTT